MSIKVHFLKSHLIEFPANLGDVSDGGEISRSMEHIYVMGDYSWSIQKDCADMKHSRLSGKRKLVP